MKDLNIYHWKEYERAQERTRLQLDQQENLGETTEDSEEESTGEQNVAVIGATVREELFGDSNPIGEVIKVKNVPFRIIGVQDNLGTVFFQDLDDQIFVPFGIAQRQIIGITYLQNALVKINSSENIKSSISRRG